jgi:cytochrome c oxidase assembly factor CtaG
VDFSYQPGLESGACQECTVVTLISILIGLGLIALTLLYFRGWTRLRRRGVRFASFFRLFVFCFAVAMIALAFFSPLQWWHDQYFFARVGQTIALCLLAAPALFVSCAFDVALWGLPPRRRRAVGRRIRSHGKVNQALRRLTQPWLVIFLFLALYVLWYDPGISNWLLVRPTAHLLGLGIVWGGALLFWWHIVSTGPRLHREFSPWLAALAMLLLELANMSASMTIVFAAEPIYAHYAAVASIASGGERFLTLMDDQTVGGGMLWVFGSAVYLSTIVLVLNRLFERHGADRARPLEDWDADERMIIPGLEHRVRK